MSDPSENIIEEESRRIFLAFCTFVMNITGKKLSMQNVFVTTLQTPKYMRVIKTLLNMDSDYEVVRLFLDYDPTIAKSKYVSKYISDAKA